MFNSKQSLLAVAVLFAATAPALAQSTTNTIPAKPTGRSDVKPNGAMKPKVMSPGTATEGRSGAETDTRGTTTESGTTR